MPQRRIKHRDAKAKVRQAQAREDDVLHRRRNMARGVKMTKKQG